MKHILIQVTSNVEGVTNGCDVAKLTWNNAIRGQLREWQQAFVNAGQYLLCEMVFKLPIVAMLEAPDPSSDINLEEAFGESQWIVVNNSFVNKLSQADVELAGTFCVVFDSGFKWRTYLADSEVIIETQELPWTILDTET